MLKKLSLALLTCSALALPLTANANLYVTGGYSTENITINNHQNTLSGLKLSAYYTFLGSYDTFTSRYFYGRGSYAYTSNNRFNRSTFEGVLGHDWVVQTSPSILSLRLKAGPFIGYASSTSNIFDGKNSLSYSGMVYGGSINLDFHLNSNIGLGIFYILSYNPQTATTKDGREISSSATTSSVGFNFNF